MTSPVEPARIHQLNDRPFAENGRYVLYWMQQSQRAVWNPALEHAAACANAQKQPLAVCFGLMDGYPEANLRHYTFMLEGLQDVAETLRERGVSFATALGDPAEVALRFGRHASMIVADRGYLRHQIAWRKQVAKEAHCPVIQVEGDVVVPVEEASTKCEVGARTLRPRIWRKAEEYLQPLRAVHLQHSSAELAFPSLDLTDVPKLCARLRLDGSVPAVSRYFRGGATEAKKRFRRFLSDRMADYAEHRNHPETDDVSSMAMHLHFGQISPVWLTLEARKLRGVDRQNLDVFVEELLVRRELAMNFVSYEPCYDSYEAAPAWARETLEKHCRDRREHLYRREEFEEGKTHDRYWNAAMQEMRSTGYMHNYMRMYWGKKILEWSKTPEDAHATALALNNKYFLDGRDANSYGNIAWLFGRHDRPWPERPVYGKVRSMTAGGLKRKCDIEGYCRKVESLARTAEG